LITRILFGNTNTNYISNFYNQKTPDLDKIDTYLKEIQEDLDKEADEVEKQYEDLNKKD
jgi:2-oxoglutarate dehydrogenase complex dehydrogenase (E1) component-like enzyme